MSRDITISTAPVHTSPLADDRTAAEVMRVARWYAVGGPGTTADWDDLTA